MTPDESIRAVADYLRELAPDATPRDFEAAIMGAITAALDRRDLLRARPIRMAAKSGRSDSKKRPKLKS